MSESYHKIPKDFVSKLFRRPTPTKLDSNVLQYLNERTLGGPNKKVRIKADLSTVAEDEFIKKINYDEKICEMPDNPRSTYLMVFSPDGSRVASTHGNHNVYVTDVKTGKNIKTLVGHPRTPWCIAFHPTSNQIIASGCLGGEVRIWDLSGSSELWTTKSQSVIASIAFHPSERLLLIATGNIIYFWDWRKPEPGFHIATNNPEEKIRYIAFDNLGQKLITGIAIDPHDKPVKVSFLRSPVRSENVQGTTNPARVTYAQYVSNRDGTSNGTQVNTNTIANEATNRSRSFFTPRNEGSFLQLTREYEQLVRTYFRTSQTAPSSSPTQTNRNRSDASNTSPNTTHPNSSESSDPQPSTSQNFSSSSLIVPSKLLMLKRAKDSKKNNEHDYCKPSSSKLAKKETDQKSSSEPETCSTASSISPKKLSTTIAIAPDYLKQILDNLPKNSTGSVRVRNTKTSRSSGQECPDGSPKNQKSETATRSEITPSEFSPRPSCSNVRQTQEGLDTETRTSNLVHERPDSPEIPSEIKKLKTARDSENVTRDSMDSTSQPSCSNRSIKNRPSAKVRMFDPKKYGPVSGGQSGFPSKSKTRSATSSSNPPGINIKIHRKQPRKSVVGKALNNIQRILKTNEDTNDSNVNFDWIEDTLRQAVNDANAILRKAGYSKNVNSKPKGSSASLDDLRDAVNTAEAVLRRTDRSSSSSSASAIPKPEGPCDSLDTAGSSLNATSGSYNPVENPAESSTSTKNNNQLCLVNSRVRFNFDMSKFNGGTYASLRLFPSTARLLLNSVHQEKLLNSLDINNILDRIMNIFIDYKKSRQGQKNHKKFVIRPDLWLHQTASRAITHVSNSNNGTTAPISTPRRTDSPGGGRRHIQRIREFVPKKIDYSELTVRNRRTTAGTIGTKRTEFNPGALKKILEELKNEMRATSSSPVIINNTSIDDSNESNDSEMNSQNGRRPLNRRSASSSKNSPTVPASRVRETTDQTESRSSGSNPDTDQSSSAEFSIPHRTSRYLKEGVYEYAQIQLLRRVLAKSIKYVRFFEGCLINSRSPSAQPTTSNGTSNTPSPPMRTTRDFRDGTQEEATPSTSQTHSDSDGGLNTAPPSEDHSNSNSNVSSSNDSPQSRLDTASRRSFNLNRSHTGSAFTTYSSSRTRTKVAGSVYSLANTSSLGRMVRKLERLVTEQMHLQMLNQPHLKITGCSHVVGERLMAAKVQECVQRINRKFGTKLGNDLIGDQESTDTVIIAKRDCFSYNARYFLTHCANNMSKHIAENALFTISPSHRTHLEAFLSVCLFLADLLLVRIIDCVPPFDREEERDEIMARVRQTCSGTLLRRTAHSDGFTEEVKRSIRDFHSSLEENSTSNNRSANSDVHHHGATTSISSSSTSNNSSSSSSSNLETTTTTTTTPASYITITNNVGDDWSASARTRPTTTPTNDIDVTNDDVVVVDNSSESARTRPTTFAGNINPNNNRAHRSTRTNWREDTSAALPRRNEICSMLVQAMRRSRGFNNASSGGTSSTGNSTSSTGSTPAPVIPSTTAAASQTADRPRSTFRLLHAWRENHQPPPPPPPSAGLPPMLSLDALSSMFSMSTHQFLEEFGSLSSAASSSSSSVSNGNNGDGTLRNLESRNVGSSSVRSSTSSNSPHHAAATRSNPPPTNGSSTSNSDSPLSPVFHPLERQQQQQHRVRIIPTVRLNDRPVPHDLPSQHRLGPSTGGHHTISNLEERLAQHRIAMRSRFLHPFYSIHTLSSQVDEQAREQPTHGATSAAASGTTAASSYNNSSSGNTVNRDVHVVTPNFRIQIWNMDGGVVPDINDASKNVVVKECKIQNDASVDISKDGTILVTLLPSGGYLNVTNRLGVYSLKKESLGQCLYTTCLEQNAVSVAFSPQCRHLVVGLASRRVSVVPSERWIMARIFAINNKKDASSSSSTAQDITNSNLLVLRELSQTRDNASPRSVNCIRWLPASGQGLIYGTNTGQLVILS